MPTKIEYVHESWNPIQDKRKGKYGRGYHCTKISEGCQNCWAENINRRFGNGLPFDDTPVEFELIPEILEKPLHWKKPRRILVQPMGDLFHESLDFKLIIDILEDVIWHTRDRHTYLILTKRPHRMKQFFDNFLGWKDLYTQYPVWLGVTAENQPRANERISILLQILAVKRFVSIEPMLTDMDIRAWLPPFEGCDHYQGGCTRPENVFAETKNPSSRPGLESCRPEYCVFGRRGLDWVILGGESGPGARPMHPDWLRTIRDQCLNVGVPFFFKQWGEWGLAYGRRKPGLKLRICRCNEVEPLEYTEETLPKSSFLMFGTRYVVGRFGKKATGNLLDGKKWREYPN